MCRRLRYWMVLPLFMSLGFAILAEGNGVGGETPGSEKFGIGHPATPLEVQRWNIDINPGGEGLPKGQGTAQLGARVYAKHCAGCHGPTGLEGPKPSLVGGQGTLGTPHPAKTVGSYWPYATTLYDYIYRAMPPTAPQSLSPDQVYALVAWILFRNGIIKETDVLTAQTLPTIPMPNHEGFVSDPRPDVPTDIP